MTKLKIAITGATGFVGQQLVPRLIAAEAEIMVVGRDLSKLETTFPNCNKATYAEFTNKAHGYDMVVHMAAMNSDASADAASFEAANVTLTQDLIRATRDAGIPVFVNFASLHALDEANNSFYAKTKRDAASLVRNAGDVVGINLFLPAIYGASWAGKLAILNRLPKMLRSITFNTLSSLKPVLHVQKLTDELLELQKQTSSQDIIITDGQANNRVYGFLQRVIDLGFACAIFGLLWWLLIIIWAAVRLQSEGPGLFTQRRIGQNGEAFTCYKFRTMEQGTVQAGTHEIGAASVAKMGHFLRKTKLDELPQAWNILRNQMSLIGPRPCLPVQHELIEERRKRGVLALKPGISGLSQINDIDMSNPEKLAIWDEKYLKLQSLILDVKIIIATAIGRGGGDKVNTKT